MGNVFDLTKLAIDPRSLLSPRRHRPLAVRRHGRFLRGPISMTWLETAAKLPGRALHVALAIQHQAALERSSSVALSNKHCSALGVDRDAKRLGLAVLEANGLVIVDRKPGRNPLVTIVDL
jgi:DNA-binding transcriptional ArsR family regulator